MVGAYKAHMSEMAIFSAIELDNYLLGGEQRGESKRVGEFATALRDYDSRYDLSLWKAMGSPDITLEEIALQIKLLENELSDVENLSKDRMEGLRDFCTSASRQFLSDTTARTKLFS